MQHPKTGKIEILNENRFKLAFFGLHETNVFPPTEVIM